MTRRLIHITGNFPCEAPVRVSATETWTRLRREADARRAGRDPAKCGRRSMYKVDGACMCLNHAGQNAIQILLGNA